MSKLLKFYADFTGRANCKEFIFSNIVMFFSILPSFMWVLFWWLLEEKPTMRTILIGFIPYVIMSLFTLLPTLALATRRMHDVGKRHRDLWQRNNSYALRASEKEANQYGEVPTSGKVRGIFYINLVFQYIIILPIVILVFKLNTEFMVFVHNENLKGIWCSYIVEYNDNNKEFPTKYGKIDNKDYESLANDGAYYLTGLAKNIDDNMPLAIHQPKISPLLQKVLKQKPIALICHANGMITHIEIPSYKSNNLNLITEQIINSCEDLSIEDKEKIRSRIAELEKQ